MATAVKARNDDHFIIRSGIDQPIGKSPERRTPRVTIYGLVLKWIFDDRDRSSLKGLNELGNEVLFLRVVPVGSRRQFDAGGRSNHQPTGHLRRDQSHSRT